MIKPDQQKLRLLIILLIVLGVTLFIGYRMNKTPNPAVVQAEAQKPSVAPPVQSDARIRLDLLDKQSGNDDLGKKNLFSYGPPPAPPAPPVSARPPISQGQAPGNPNGIAGPSTSVNRPPPPPPPPIPLKYIGYAFVEPNSKQLIATVIDDTQHHFNVEDGDFVMGRYRVTHITDTSLDVEDLQFSRHQILPLVKQ